MGSDLAFELGYLSTLVTGAGFRDLQDLRINPLLEWFLANALQGVDEQLFPFSVKGEGGNDDLDGCPEKPPPTLNSPAMVVTCC